MLLCPSVACYVVLAVLLSGVAAEGKGREDGEHLGPGVGDLTIHSTLRECPWLTRMPVAGLAFDEYNAFPLPAGAVPITQLHRRIASTLGALQLPEAAAAAALNKFLRHQQGL